MEEIKNKLKEKASEFKVEIGTRFKDYKRDITIIDKEYRIRNKNNGRVENQKWYKYKCNKCGWTEGWSEENQLLGKYKVGCLCCANQIVVEGINDIPTTAPWMIKYFQGGYDEAKLYTKGSGKKIKPICPDCGRIKDSLMFISNIYKRKSINCSCSDKMPYTEKFMFSVLEQLNLNFQTQLNKTTYEWCENYRYDFYFELNNESYICEVHGKQHYEENTNFKKTLKEEQENDKLKKELALANGIKEENYIVIDCRYSELEWIQNNILKSRLNELFNLLQIDWIKCEEFALSNLVKEACEYKRDNPDYTTEDIGKIMNLNRSTICRYLKIGNELGWCYYDAKKESLKGNSYSGKLNGISVLIIKNTLEFYLFNSAHESERESESVLGIKLTHVSRACKEFKKYKGVICRYVKDLTPEEYIKYDIKNKLKEIQENTKLNKAI
jgi:hypothetical protein